jgi:hypothetical protein
LARLDAKQQASMLSGMEVGYCREIEPGEVEDDEAEPGTCRFCGCEEDHACQLDDPDDPEGDAVPCKWANAERTVCTNPECLEEFNAQTGQGGEPKWQPTAMSVAQLRSEIRDSVLKVLSGAPFPLDGALPPIACVECPKRSGNAQLLFEDCGRDTCTDRDCFEAKVKVWIKAELEDADKEKRKLVMLCDGYSGIQAAVSKWNVTVIPEEKPIKPCDRQEEAIWVNGESAGHRTMICRDSKCTTHGSGAGSSHSNSSRSVPTKDSAKADAERKKALAKLNAEKKYRAALFAAVAVAPIQTLYASDLNLELCLYAIGRAPGQYNNKVAEALGWSAKLLDWNGSKQLRETLQKLSPVERLRVALVAAHSGELAVNEYSASGKPQDLEKLATLLGLEPKKIRAASEGKSEGVQAKKAPAKKPPAKTAKKAPAKKATTKPAKKRGLMTPEAKKRIAAAVKKRRAGQAKARAVKITPFEEDPGAGDS